MEHPQVLRYYKEGIILVGCGDELSPSSASAAILCPKESGGMTGGRPIESGVRPLEGGSKALEEDDGGGSLEVPATAPPELPPPTLAPPSLSSDRSTGPSEETGRP